MDQGKGLGVGAFIVIAFVVILVMLSFSTLDYIPVQTQNPGTITKTVIKKTKTHTVQPSSTEIQMTDTVVPSDTANPTNTELPLPAVETSTIVVASITAFSTNTLFPDEQSTDTITPTEEQNRITKTPPEREQNWTVTPSSTNVVIISTSVSLTETSEATAIITNTIPLENSNSDSQQEELPKTGFGDDFRIMAIAVIGLIMLIAITRIIRWVSHV